VKLKTVKNINGRARKRHLAKPQNVSKQLNQKIPQKEKLAV